jgi:hypothetical protein
VTYEAPFLAFLFFASSCVWFQADLDMADITLIRCDCHANIIAVVVR